MKIGYFFVLCFVAVPLSVKSNVVDDIKNWWQSLTEEKKQKFRTSVQEETYKTYTPEWTWEYITKPQADQTYDYVAGRVAEDVGKITSKIKQGALITAGAAVVTGASYALYRWLARRGLGGITNDFKTVDTNKSTLLHNIDKKIIELKRKKPLLQKDKELGDGLLLLIRSKEKDWAQDINKLREKGDAIAKIVKGKNKEKTPAIPKRAPVTNKIVQQKPKQVTEEKPVQKEMQKFSMPKLPVVLPE